MYTETLNNGKRPIVDWGDAEPKQKKRLKRLGRNLKSAAQS
jgi:hypothetical protein